MRTIALLWAGLLALAGEGLRICSDVRLHPIVQMPCVSETDRSNHEASVHAFCGAADIIVV